MSKHKVALDLAMPSFLMEPFLEHCEFVPWDVITDGDEGARAEIAAVVTYAHPRVDAALLAQLPNLKVVSNYGVGVDHIVVPDCEAAGIPVGNTPGAVNGATADITICLLYTSPSPRD